MTKIVSCLLFFLTIGSAFAGNPQSISLFTTGQKHFDKNEFSLALADWQKAADLGDTQAMNKLADMYTNGTGVPVDAAKAQEYWQKAAARGDGDAMYEVAMYYEFAQDAAQNKDVWKKWFQQALDNCSEKAAVQVIVMANASADETAKATECLKKNAGMGNYEAMVYLSDRNGASQPVVKNPLEAISWGQMAVDTAQKKADGGDRQAMCFLGKILFEGVGAVIPADPRRGLKLCEKAASLGNVDAMNWLLSVYVSNDKYLDYKKVSFWNKKIIEQYTARAKKGDVSAMLSLADKYFRPPTGVGRDMGRPIEGTKREAAKAVEWAKKAAAFGSRKALFLLGYIYEDASEDNPLHDCKKARIAYEGAAALGDRNAIDRMAAKARGAPFLTCNF